MVTCGDQQGVAEIMHMLAFVASCQSEVLFKDMGIRALFSLPTASTCNKKHERSTREACTLTDRPVVFAVRF